MQLLAGVEPPVFASQPLATEEMGAGEVGRGAGAAQPLERLAEPVLVVSVDLPGDVPVLRQVCGAAPDDAMIEDTEVPSSRVHLLKRFGAIPVDPDRYRYFIGETSPGRSDGLGG